MTAPKDQTRRASPRKRQPVSAGEPVETRDHLLDCALTVFADQGYAATSVRNIIGVAGVTQPTLYYHFENKQCLFLELLRTRYDAALQELQYEVAQVTGCRNQLLAIIQSSFAYCAADPRVPRLMFQTAYGPAIPGITEHLDRLSSQRFDIVKSVIQAGINAGELQNSSLDGLTLAFCCLMDQHINVLSRLSDAKDHLSPQLATWLVDLFLQGADLNDIAIVELMARREQ